MVLIGQGHQQLLARPDFFLLRSHLFIIYRLYNVQIGRASLVLHRDASFR